MRSDDLVPFLPGPQPGPGVGFRQGVILTWDQQTAENTVLVGRSVLTDLQCLNISEASLLVPGDVVGIMTAGQTWAIMGRFIYPGTPEAVSSIRSITDRIQAASDVTSGSRSATGWGDLTGVDVGPAVTIRIGPSGRALAFWSAEIGQTANWQTRNTPHVGVEITGPTLVSPSSSEALNFHYEFPGSGFAGHAQMQSWFQAGTCHLYEGLNPGMHTFTLKYRHDTINPVGAVSFSTREIAVFAL